MASCWSSVVFTRTAECAERTRRAWMRVPFKCTRNVWPSNRLLELRCYLRSESSILWERTVVSTLNKFNCMSTCVNNTPQLRQVAGVTSIPLHILEPFAIFCHEIQKCYIAISVNGRFIRFWIRRFQAEGTKNATAQCGITFAACHLLEF